MGSTHHPTVPGGRDVGRDQNAAPGHGLDQKRDPESMERHPGGAATTRLKWGHDGSSPNGPGPRDRGRRS